MLGRALRERARFYAQTRAKALALRSACACLRT